MPNNEARSQTPAREDYIKAIYRLGGVDRAVHTTELADMLAVRKPSVTGMLKRLAADGLLDYGPRQGARLTATGAAAGLRVVRRHRLIETFLVLVNLGRGEGVLPRGEQIPGEAPQPGDR
ncbi:MAG: hypothetical protein V3T86_18110, partial [Planctomycetota bacterium]